MSDADTAIAGLRREIAAFVHARDWEKFHNPKDLAAAIAIEAAELMELFLWKGPQELNDWVEQKEARRNIQEELADVMILCVSFANRMNIDITDAVLEKLTSNEVKYPVEQVRGRSDKYTQYAKDV